MSFRVVAIAMIALFSCGRSQQVLGCSDAPEVGWKASRTLRTTSFERDGYRITHEYRATRDPVGLVVIGAAHRLEEARRLARKASAALGLPYAEREYVPDYGFTLSDLACTEIGYPCAPDPRYWEEPLAYISIEQGDYEQWRSREFVVVAAHGVPGSDLLGETLTKARAVFPGASEVATRGVWIVSSTSRLSGD